RREEERVVPLRDRLRRDQVGGLLRAALRGDEAGRRNMPSLDEVDRRRRGRGRELADVLEHRHRLPARDDVLNALRGRVLAAERDRVQLVGLQRDDDGVRKPVVGRGDGVDLVAGLHEHLLEDRAGLLVVPTGHELLRALLQRPVRVERVEDLVDSALEQERVRVLLAAPQRGDDGMRAALAGRLEAGVDALALQHADRVAVERRVQHGHAALDLAVVVDRPDTRLGSALLDRRSGGGVDRGDDQDPGAVGDALVGLRLLLLRVTLGVDDARGHTGVTERLLERRAVELLPANRRLGVRQQGADLNAGRLLGRTGDRDDERRERGDDSDRDHLPRTMLHELPPSLAVPAYVLGRGQQPYPWALVSQIL